MKAGRDRELPSFASGGVAARLVEPELLDELSEADPRAIRSRQDLVRINACMGNARLLSGLLRRAIGAELPRSVAEIGGGDGTFMLRVARRLSGQWPAAALQLVDRKNLLAPETSARFEAIGWKATAIQADVFEWLDHAEQVDIMVANLFLHHFEGARLSELLDKISAKARLFVACEPRRLRFPGLAAGCIWLMGCNDVTRHDAIVSVRAGFIGQELSALWPEKARWQLHEAEGGLGSHCFRAIRVPGTRDGLGARLG